jgi:hypothetical protein
VQQRLRRDVVTPTLTALSGQKILEQERNIRSDPLYAGVCGPDVRSEENQTTA